MARHAAATGGFSVRSVHWTTDSISLKCIIGLVCHSGFASPLLVQLLRDTLNFTGVMESDEGAVQNMESQFHYTSSAQETVQAAFTNGQSATQQCTYTLC